MYSREAYTNFVLCNDDATMLCVRTLQAYNILQFSGKEDLLLSSLALLYFPSNAEKEKMQFLVQSLYSHEY